MQAHKDGLRSDKTPQDDTMVNKEPTKEDLDRYCKPYYARARETAALFENDLKRATEEFGKENASDLVSRAFVLHAVALLNMCTKGKELECIQFIRTTIKEMNETRKEEQ